MNHHLSQSSLGLKQRVWRILLNGLIIVLIGWGCIGLISDSALADQPDASELIIVAGKIKIKPGTKEKFSELAQKCLVPSRKEPGSISYSYYEDQTEPNTILYFEEWRDQAALDFHFQTPYFKEFIDQAQPLFDGSPEITVYRVAGSKTL